MIYKAAEKSADHGIIAGPEIHLPHVSCLMIKELVPGALEHIHGIVSYSFYRAGVFLPYAVLMDYRKG